METRVLLQLGLWGRTRCSHPSWVFHHRLQGHGHSQCKLDFAHIGADSGHARTRPRCHAAVLSAVRCGFWLQFVSKLFFCFSFLDHSFCSLTSFTVLNILSSSPCLFHISDFFLVVDFTFIFFLAQALLSFYAP